MKSTNKNFIIRLGLLTLLVVILSTLTYAKPLTEGLRGGLVQVNSFFANENYKPFAKTIDFFFFGLLFIAIYMMGARYAFKEVKRPEQTIVILLGLMTSFLLVLGGFSATLLIPYIHWLLYLLLFMLLWWLLKGIKSPFWRFLLALLLTLLLIWLLPLLLDALSGAEIKGDVAKGDLGFGSLSDSFKAMQFPEFAGVPGVPDYLTDIFGPSITPTYPETLPTTITEKVKKEEKGGIPWWVWVAIPVLLFLLYKNWGRVRDAARGLRRERPAAAAQQRPLDEIVNDIERIIREKINARNEIVRKWTDKHNFIVSNLRIIIDELGHVTDPAYLWEVIRRLEQQHQLYQLSEKESELTVALEGLKTIERNFYNQLDTWLQTITTSGMDAARIAQITQEINEIKNLIIKELTDEQIREIRVLIDNFVNIYAREFVDFQRQTQSFLTFIGDTGIIRLIIAGNDFMKHEILLERNLQNYLTEKNVNQLIDLFLKDKFERIKIHVHNLRYYDYMERMVIELLREKIREQIARMRQLRNWISGAAPPPQPVEPPAPETPQPTITSIQPNTGVQNSTVQATITGTNLTGATSVVFSGTQGEVTAAINAGGTATTLPIRITITQTATLGDRTFTVETPQGTANSGNIVFTITQQPTPAPATPPPPAPRPAPAPPTQGVGTINFTATLDGQPWSGALDIGFRYSRRLLARLGILNRYFINIPYSRDDYPAGNYRVYVYGGPGNFSSITPSENQTLRAGGGIIFTFNFVAPPPRTPRRRINLIRSGIPAPPP